MTHTHHPGIYCDNCGDPCRPYFIAGQCQICGGYICKGCVPFHVCIRRDKAEVKRMNPEYVDYNVNVDGGNPSNS